MEPTKSMMLLPEQIKTEAAKYSRMGTKSLCSSVGEEQVVAPNQDGVQLRQRFVAHQKELCSLKKMIEESESTLKTQSAEIKRLRKLTKDSEDLLHLLLNSKR
jgi:2-iminoacetate synthase ThiH